MGQAQLACDKKKARALRCWIAFQDESGISQRPSIRRTWAPKGETPVLVHAFNWTKLSVAAVLAFSWTGKRNRLFFQTKPGSYDSVSLICFLQDLKTELHGRKCILIWDGLPAHKSRVMKHFLESQKRWLRTERLPGYAPDLNPVEPLWGNIKGRELANFCADDLDEIGIELRKGMRRVTRDNSLAKSFLKHTGLFF